MAPKPDPFKAFRPLIHRVLTRSCLLVALAAPWVTAWGVVVVPLHADAGVEVPKPPADAPYRNASMAVDQRVADLLSRMTLEEKMAQVVCIWSGKNEMLNETSAFLPEKAAEVFPHGFGHVARPSDMWQRGEDGVTPGRGIHETIDLVNTLQRYLVEETRLGIPAMMHAEGLHGHQAHHATSFPQAIALASTWDPVLVEQVYTVVAREIAARGAKLVLSPVVDVARDPRWGRIEETFGEDPHLVAEMGLAVVRGFQGRFGRDEGAVLAPDRVFATLKHMTGHGQPESGTNVGPANLSERILREAFFPPFERAVQEAGALAVMASYNEIDGVPSHVNRWLLDDVLRGEWGFDGLVVSDYFAVAELVSRHSVAGDKLSAARQALEAGIDVELPDGDAFPLLADLFRSGTLEVALLDQAVARSLRAKLLAGLFERPYTDPAGAEDLIGNREARALAQGAAERSVILLKNDGELLPLDPASLGTIAVIGPNADAVRLGGYSGRPKDPVTLLGGVRAWMADHAPDTELIYAQGVGITEDDNWWGDDVQLVDPDQNRRGIAEAVEVAKRADVVIVAVGDTEQTSREAWAEGHLGDRLSLELVGQQDELVRALIDTGTPTVVVLIHGRPMAVVEIAESAPAILDAWYLGQEAGTALARVLFGEVNPGGKLPVTVPRSVGQLPLLYHSKPTAHRGYLFGSTEPLWPFGHGLSYTTFELGEPVLDMSEIPVGDTARLSVELKNTGDRAGDEVVQIYLRDVVSSVTRPVKELVAFERVTLGPGESRTLRFDIGPRALRHWNRSMQRRVEPGEFQLMVGTSSVDHQSVTLTVSEAVSEVVSEAVSDSRLGEPGV